MQSKTTKLYAALLNVSLLTLASCATSQQADRRVLDPNDADAVISVTGLSCPQCANNIKLLMDDAYGIDISRVDLGTGQVYIDFSEGSTLSDEDIQRLVKDAGFTPGQVQHLKKEAP